MSLFLPAYGTDRGRQSPRSPPIATGMLFLTALVVSLGVAELLARKINAGAAWPQPPPEPPELAQLPRLESVMALAARNQVGVYRGRFYRTNSAGFRGKEYPRQKSEGTFRIVVIGDSITMGEGVDESETYSALLERRLRIADPGHYDVLNLGISGLNIRDSLARLQHIGLLYDPDLIVYGFTINDLEGLPGYQLIRPSSPLPAIFFRSALVRLVWARWNALRDFVAPAPGSYIYEIDQNFFHNPPTWSAFLDDLNQLAATGKHAGACVAVLIHTQLRQLAHLHPTLRHYRAVESAAAERGMYVINPMPFVEGFDPAATTVGPFDPHPNARGHELFAQALEDGLQRLPDSCWKGHRPALPAPVAPTGTTSG